LKPDLYIHAGFHKTGTTAIQHFLDMNYENLLRQGILYPLQVRLMLEKATYAHHGIAWYFGFGGKMAPINDVRKKVISAKQIRESIHREADQYGVKSIVLSSEVFSENFDDDKFAKVLDFLSDFKVYIIYYIRRQDNFMISDFKHRVTHFGHHKSIEEMLDNQIINYHKRIKFFSKHIKKENILVRVYEEIDKESSIYEDVITCVGGRMNKSFRYPKASQSNRSLTNDYVETMRICNGIFDQKELKKIRTYLIGSHSWGKQKDQTSLLSPQQRMNIIKNHYKSNLILARDFLKRDDGLFNPAEIDVSKLPPDHRLYAEDFVKIMARLNKTRKGFQLRSMIGKLIRKPYLF